MHQSELETFVSRGQTRYRCPDCEFDHYSPGDVAHHWIDSHAAKENLMGSSLFTADDTPVTKEIVLPWGSRMREDASSIGTDDLDNINFE